MLALDDPRWGELSHAYGSAADTPTLLRMLEADPNRTDYSEDDDNPWSQLDMSICHQGTVCSGSYAAVPHIVRIAALAADPLPIGYLLLPAYIERGRTHWSYPAPMPSDLEESYFQAVKELPALIPRVMKADLDEGAALAIMEAVLILCGRWELGEGLASMKLADVKCYHQFYFDFQHLADVRVWKSFPDEETSLFMSAPSDT